MAGAGSRVLVACSGGPDSMALLDSLHRWAVATGRFVAVGHVNHGLRRASAADARFVERQAAARGLPCAVEHVETRGFARGRGRGMEDAARTLRYRALARIARRFQCPLVVTAHTLNDQVETLFLNLLRGTGPAGLGGMSHITPWPVGPGPLLGRPFLELRRNQLLGFLRDRRIPFRVDATNRQPIFLRNRLRPVLASWDRLRPGFLERVARTAQILRDEEAYWLNLLAVGKRRSPGGNRLDRRVFLRYHVAEQRRRLRLLFGLTHFESMERVRQFAADRASGPLDLPEGKVSKTKGMLVFHRKRAGTFSPADRYGQSRRRAP